MELSRSTPLIPTIIHAPVLTERFGLTDLPPLDAIENEDWGRDLLLSRFLTIPAEALAEAGITLRDEAGERD